MGFTKKNVKHELKNFLRERNISALLAFLDLIKYFFTKKSSGKLKKLASFLSYFPGFSRYQFLIKKGKLLSLKAYSEKKSKSCERYILSNSIIIKRFVSKDERGVLLVSFETQLEKIMCSDNFNSIEFKYIIIFMPSWTGLFSPQLFALSALSSKRFYVMPVHTSERAYCKNLGEHCVALPFNAASWVNESLYLLHGERRDIDCLMVANFSEFKRHWLLFKVLSGLPKYIKAVCVGVERGKRTKDSIFREAEFYGVGDRVTIVDNPSQADLRNYFKKSKVFCAMTFREGSFISVSEALMSGTPVIMFANSHIGTKELINSRNGKLVASISAFREAILETISFKNNERIQAESISEFSASANVVKLSEILKVDAIDAMEHWTEGVENFYSMRLHFLYRDELASEFFKTDFSWLKDNGIEVDVRRDVG